MDRPRFRGVQSLRQADSIAGRRAAILALIQEYNSAVGQPGGAARAREVLQRTIEALERWIVASAGTESCEPGEGAVDAACIPILQELKTVRSLWSASETATVTADFAHAMDSLLMHEVRCDAGRFSPPRFRSRLPLPC